MAFHRVHAVALTPEMIAPVRLLAQTRKLREQPNRGTSFEDAHQPPRSYGVLSAAGAQINTLVEAQTVELSKQVDLAIESATGNAPAGTEPAVAFAKSALSAATTAADQVAKATKQVLATAEANFAAVFAALEKPLVQA